MSEKMTEEYKAWVRISLVKPEGSGFEDLCDDCETYAVCWLTKDLEEFDEMLRQSADESMTARRFLPRVDQCEFFIEMSYKGK